MLSQVVGQSSGGTSILALLSSPASVGLFHAAISLSASPNITMDLQAAYNQNAPVVSSHTQCTQPKDSEVHACLISLSAEEAQAIMPPSFGVAPTEPVSINGQGYAGFPIIDGVTVVADVLTALRQGIVDVPLILQTMLAEMDSIDPAPKIYNMDQDAYQTYLTNLLVKGGWSADAGPAIVDLYQDELAVSTELAYQQWFAEYSFFCGTKELALAAGQGFKSPVYLSLVARKPDNLLEVYPDPKVPMMRYAGHMWDYIMGTKSVKNIIFVNHITTYTWQGLELFSGMRAGDSVQRHGSRYSLRQRADESVAEPDAAPQHSAVVRHAPGQQRAGLPGQLQRRDPEQHGAVHG